MGNISAKLTRHFYRFNAENRAQKILRSEEIRPAPKYDKTLEQINILEKEMPSLKEDLAKFDPSLHDRLKQVYVTSTEVKPDENTFTKVAPLSHKVRRTIDYGFDDSEGVAPGRISLKNLVKLIMARHQEDDCTNEVLARRYKLSTDDVAKILKYYHCFTMNLPRGKFDKVTFLNTVMIGNKTGEILSAEQYIKRIEDQKGVRDELTRGIPPLNADVIRWQEEERKAREITAGDRRKQPLGQIETKQTKSEDNKE